MYGHTGVAAGMGTAGALATTGFNLIGMVVAGTFLAIAGAVLVRRSLGYGPAHTND